MATKIEKNISKRLLSKLVRRIFVIKKVKNTVPWTYVIRHLKDKEIVETFDEKEFRIKKVIKRKVDKLYVK